MNPRCSEPVYGIGAVAWMLDIVPSVLRTWEERYAVVVPVRSRGDQGLYSRDQVDQLCFVQNLMGSGLHASRPSGGRDSTPGIPVSLGAAPRTWVAIATPEAMSEGTTGGEPPCVQP
jgi:hypothetical protein